MLSQEVINTANQLPPSAQKMVVDLVDLLSFKHLANNQDKSKLAELYPSKSVEKPIEKTTYRYGKEAGFGLFTSDFDITDEEIDKAIAEAVSEI